LPGITTFLGGVDYGPKHDDTAAVLGGFTADLTQGQVLNTYD